MDIQRLRNLSTGMLHTKIDHVYEDIEYLVGEKGVMTHMLPNAMRALEPYLREKAPDPRLWDDKYYTTHQGEIDVTPMEGDAKEEFWKRYKSYPSLLAGKQVIAILGPDSSRNQ